MGRVPYQPRCAVVDHDEAFNEVSAPPRRLARRNRVVRVGIAVAAAGLVGAIAIVIPGLLAQSAAASHPPAGVLAGDGQPVRTGTTDAFSTRGTSTSRDLASEDASGRTISAVAAERAGTLGSVDQQVATAQASVAAQTRTDTLTTTGDAIDAEAKRRAAIKFFWPTEGAISSPWGMRTHPILKYTRLHGGADIGGAVGAPIHAVADGVVTRAATGYNGGSGNNVRIDHGTVEGEALETAYLHMNDLSVGEGDRVKKGQVIGSVGNTGLSTAPHLHFSVYSNGVNTDPAPYLAAGRD